MRTFTAVYASLLATTFASPNVDASDVNTVQYGTPTATIHTVSSVQEPVSLCTQYAYYSTGGYELLNNLWGQSSATSGSQCTYYEGSSGSGGIKWSSTWTWSGGEDAVKSYVYAGLQIAKGNTIAKIKAMPTQIEWSYNTTNGVRANVAYDIFTAKDPAHVNSSGDYEVMIWLARIGKIYPISQSGHPIATVTIAGYAFDLFFGYNQSMKVYSFIRSGSKDVNSFKADVKAFFDYLVAKQQFPASEQNLIVNQVGTEAFTGGPAKFLVSSFSSSVSV